MKIIKCSHLTQTRVKKCRDRSRACILINICQYELYLNMDVIFTFIDAKINFEICIIYIKNASSHNHFHSYISLTERVNFCTFSVLPLPLLLAGACI